METLLLYAICSATLFYLGSRAQITRLLWSNYPARLAILMDCAACSGTWYGAGIAYVGGYHLGLSFMGLPGNWWPTVIIAALCSTSTTPMIAALTQRALESLGHAVPLDDLAQGAPDDSGPG